MLNDLRYAIRSLGRSPGFTLVAVLTLGLGLTVNAVFFAIASNLFFRPLPAHQPGDLVVIAQRSPQIEYQLPFSYADAEDLRAAVENTTSHSSDLNRIFSGLMAYREQAVHLSIDQRVTSRAWVHAITDNYFSVLGVQPQVGRFLLPGEGAKPGTGPVIVLTDQCWRSRFGADPAIAGKTIKLNGLPFTVIGVAPQGFLGAAWGVALDGFIPSGMLTKLVPGAQNYVLSRGNSSHFLVGRLQPGVSLEEARAAVQTAFALIMKDHPGYYPPQARAVVMRESHSRPSPFIAHRTPQVTLAVTALALLVLVIAIANMANLLYARAQSRERELAIRSAIGGSRGALLRALLVESTVLSLLAGAFGALAATWATPALLAALPTAASSAPSIDVGGDWRPLVMTALTSLVVGVLAGLVPAWRASAVAPGSFLKSAARSTSARHHPFRTVLVIGQVAVSCVVLTCAFLALRSVHLLNRADLGYRTDHVLVTSFDLGLQQYSTKQGRLFHDRLLEKVRALPGVESASLVAGAPVDTRINMIGGVKPAGTTRPDSDFPNVIPYVIADHTYLETIGLRIESGRGFASTDLAGAPRVVLVNRALAERLWPGENPIGRRINVQNDHQAEVVGIVGRSRYYSVTDDARPLLISALEQNYRGNASLVVRTTDREESVAVAIQKIIHEIDPDLPIYSSASLRDSIANSANGLMPFRTGATLAASQAVIALLLAAAGIFGLISFSVALRTREIGIRVALGATRGEIIRLVAKAGLVPALAGLLIGTGLSLFVAHLLHNLLYRGAASDVPVLVAVGAVILAAVGLASWNPARRALRIDPVEALKAE